MSPGSVRNIYEVLARVFDAAADDRVIATSPCTRITLAKNHDDEVQVPTLEDIECVQVALGQRWQPLPVVLAGTGLFSESESCSASGFPTWTSCVARSASSVNGSRRAGSRR